MKASVALAVSPSLAAHFLLHHSVTINIRGDSYRLRERKKAGLLSSPLRPKVSTQPDETGEI